MNDDVSRRLPVDIAEQLSGAEREELARRLEVQDRLPVRLRELPLGDEEPSLSRSLERER